MWAKGVVSAGALKHSVRHNAHACTCHHHGDDACRPYSTDLIVIMAFCGYPSRSFSSILHRSIIKKNMPIFRIAGQHRKNVRGSFFCGSFPMSSDRRQGVFASLAKSNFFTSLAIWGCAIRIASHIAVASRDSGH